MIMVSVQILLTSCFASLSKKKKIPHVLAYCVAIKLQEICFLVVHSENYKLYEI